MSFLIVPFDGSNECQLQLADVIVLPTQPTVAAAEQSTATTLERFPGCALVTTGVRRRGCLLRYRDGCGPLVVPGEGSTEEASQLATLCYTSMVLGPYVAAKRARRSASSAAFGSPLRA